MIGNGLETKNCEKGGCNQTEDIVSPLTNAEWIGTVTTLRQELPRKNLEKENYHGYQ
jgi:hypothetical protein